MEKKVNTRIHKPFKQRQRGKKKKASGIEELFGLLKGKIKEDPVVIQRRLRDE